MYGTVAKVKAKPGRIEELLGLMDEWERDFKPHVKGAMGSLTYQLDRDPNELILCAVFASKTEYEANADDPAQDKWYQRMRACLDADPEWMDGQVLRTDF